jgi:hypothetical protein
MDHRSCFSPKSCIPRIYLSNDVWNASNEDHMPKLRPRKFDVPTYPNGAHSLSVSSPRVRSLDV